MCEKHIVSYYKNSSSFLAYCRKYQALPGSVTLHPIRVVRDRTGPASRRGQSVGAPFSRLVRFDHHCYARTRAYFCFVDFQPRHCSFG